MPLLRRTILRERDGLPFTRPNTISISSLLPGAFGKKLAMSVMYAFAVMSTYLNLYRPVPSRAPGRPEIIEALLRSSFHINGGPISYVLSKLLVLRPSLRG